MSTIQPVIGLSKLITLFFCFIFAKNVFTTFVSSLCLCPLPYSSWQNKTTTAENTVGSITFQENQQLQLFWYFHQASPHLFHLS